MELYYRAQVDQPGRRILQLTGEPERRHRAALGRAPGVVGDDAQRRAAIGDGAAHAAQRVVAIPRPRAARHGHQALQAIDVVRCGAALRGLEDLRERRSQVLGIARHPS